MKSIFITGAGAGIGLATARLFAEKGWFIGAADQDSDALAALQQALGEAQCSTHVLDVTQPATLDRALAAFAEKTGGTLDLLHNNAGILKVGHFEQLDRADHEQVIQVNVIGLINVLHAAFPYLKATPGAHVINMSSASAAYGTPDFASYSASKHAVRALTEALDIEWAPHDITVTDLMPPFVNTGMVQANAHQSPIFEQLGIHLTPDDVARAVWQQAHKPLLHRPVSLQFRALWPIARSAPITVTRRILRHIWQSR